MGLPFDDHSPVEDAGFICLAFALLASVVQGIVLQAQFDRVTEHSLFERQRKRLIIFGVAELFMLAAVIVLNAIENVLEREEWRSIYWFAWAALIVEAIELVSEVLANALRVQDHHMVRCDLKKALQRNPDYRQYELREWHIATSRVAAIVVTASVVLSGMFIGFAVVREPSDEVCNAPAVSNGMLITCVVVAFICSVVVLFVLIVVKRKLFLFNELTITSDRFSVFEIVLSMVESLPAIFVLGLALSLLLPNENSGCVGLGRKLGGIGLVLEMGPVAKLLRQLARKFFALFPIAVHEKVQPKTDSSHDGDTTTESHTYDSCTSKYATDSDSRDSTLFLSSEQSQTLPDLEDVVPDSGPVVDSDSEKPQPAIVGPENL